MYIDPNTGQEMSPEQAQQMAMQANSQQAQQQNTANAPTQGDQGVPGSAVDNAVYSQEEQRQDAQNTAAQQAATYNNAPPNLKVTITNLANQLLGADLFSRQSVLQNLAARSPALANMVKERIGMISAGMQ
ncbi:MAG: hypothetical protein BWY14_01269 [Parcubacteria group bacterium ADurb.Bin192]|nr:MAG: hypothetical protein BWY14_01269 [Parcubacteria group bacterium ADurb.Bin192]